MLITERYVPHHRADDRGARWHRPSAGAVRHGKRSELDGYRQDVVDALVHEAGQQRPSRRAEMLSPRELDAVIAATRGVPVDRVAFVTGVSGRTVQRRRKIMDERTEQ